MIFGLVKTPRFELFRRVLLCGIFSLSTPRRGGNYSLPGTRAGARARMLVVVHVQSIMVV